MDDPTKDTIPRSAVEYCLRKETVSTNPEKYKTHEKFIDYMNDPDISEFGHWMHSNGFNCALTTISVDLKKIPSVTPSAQPGWIPVTERLPEIHKRVILSLTDGTVMVGFQGEPDCIWQVTDDDGKKIWVYDPEAYTDNVDDLPTAKDCWFDGDDPSGMSYTSVTSLNYRERFPGVVAWMPLPTPYREGGQDGV